MKRDNRSGRGTQASVCRHDKGDGGIDSNDVKRGIRFSGRDAARTDGERNGTQKEGRTVPSDEFV